MNLVYTKTPAGEQAVQERTRLVQRNLRNVLIIVDGRSTVQGLCDRVGKPKVVESALKQLERDGYIVPLPPPQSADVPLPEETTGGAPEPAGGLGTAARGPASIGPFSLPGPARDEAGPFAAAPAPRKLAREPAAPGVLGGLFRKKAPKGGDDIKFSGADWNDSKIAIKPIKRGATRKIGLLGWVSIALLVAGIAVVATIAMFPYDMYRADFEAGMTQALGRPVRIESVRGSVVPSPVIVLDRVRIGDGEGLLIDEVHVVPAPTSIVGGARVFRRVDVIGARAAIEDLVALTPAVMSLSGGGAFAVRSLHFERAVITVRGYAFSPLSGQVSQADDGQAGSIVLRSDGAAASVAFAASEGKVRASIELAGWKPVADSPFVWDLLKVSGVITGNTFVGDKLEGRLLEGFIKGRMRAEWGDRGFGVGADVEIEGAAAKRLADAAGVPSLMDGDFGSRLTIAADADRLEALVSRGVVEGDFVFRRMTVNGLDLIEAVRRGSRATTRGGATRFDQVTGKVAWDGKILRLQSLDGGSGGFHAVGSMNVGNGQRTNGSFDVRLKGSVTEVRMPVAVSGTLKDLLLQGGQR